MNGEKPSVLLNRKDNRRQLFLVGSLTLLPSFGAWNVARLVIALILAFPILLNRKIRLDRMLKKVFIPMIVSLILPIVAVFICELSLDITSVVHEIERLLFYILVIYLCFHYEIDFEALFKIATVLFIVHLAIQILQFSGFQPVFDLIEKNYLQPGDSGIHLSLAKRQTLLDFRSGSIFMNPNVYMVIPCTYLGLVFQKLLKKPNILGYLLVASTVVSLLLTGSRTSIVVFFLILIMYLYNNNDYGRIKWIVLFPIFVLVIWVMFFSSLSETYRAFDIASGLGGSFGAKIKLLGRYFLENNPLYFVTGSLGSNKSFSTDFEWGHIYSCFGIVGLIWYIRFLKVFKRNNTNYSFLCNSVLFIVLCIGLTASVVLCLPVFPFVCIVILPQIRDNSTAD